jgi:transcriptional regulator GlxA family with amidase domain
MFGSLALNHTLNLTIIARTLDPVSTKPQSAAMNKFNSSFGITLQPTHNFTSPSLPNLDLLLIPGGGGTRSPDLDPEIAFIQRIAPHTRTIMTVCTGATLAARAGVLDGRNATTNKRAWAWATSTGPRTNWIAHARWVRDGNVWTTSGVSAGIDGALDWVAYFWGNQTAADLTLDAEYKRTVDWTDDPFADAYGDQDVPAKLPVGPAGLGGPPGKGA